ncbi:protein FAM219A-like [Gigantopelta aegis]|uniref:protein FAM219A-like n=1 Tax=Gigantopelta aegis TaxID=1735272 RepID=UPI001B889F7C|nr:protein FAM219A-like [Gigantopelta aegis]
MDSMEDSGFDSDQKSQNGQTEKDPSLAKSSSFKTLKRAADLQKKIEKQRELAKKAQAHAAAIDQQPKMSRFGSKNRVTIPEIVPLNPGKQPLITIVSDDSDEDEFDLPVTGRHAHRDITEQLVKDGYNLDLEPDDEDLDLIPPRPFNERCTCCQLQTTCVIQ